MARVQRDRLALVAGWVNDALPILNLSAWRVTIAKAPSGQDAWAEIDPHAQSQDAELYIGWDLLKQPAERVREILTHELLHLLTCRADGVVENLEEPLGKQAWAVWHPAYEDAAERSVDDLSRLIAPLLPLPGFTEEA